MTTDCKHAHIQTWRFEDSAEVAGLWSCTDCGRRFEPVAAAPEPVAWQWLDTAHFRRKVPATSNAALWRPLYAAVKDKP